MKCSRAGSHRVVLLSDGLLQLRLQQNLGQLLELVTQARRERVILSSHGLLQRVAYGCHIFLGGRGHLRLSCAGAHAAHGLYAASGL